MKCAIVFEKSKRNYAAYVPDLPGCVATGKSRDNVERNIREVMALHLDGLKEDGGDIPESSAWTESVEIG